MHEGIEVDPIAAIDDPPARLAALQATNKSLERHARALSHDLRAPLASTISGLKLLSQFGDRLTEDDRREILDRSVTRLGELVEHMDSLLDEATIDAGEDLAPTDSGLALQWVLAGLEHADAERLTTLIDELPLVMARRVALRQVLQNIISNTLRHNAGPVSIAMTAERVGADIHLHIDDDGVGFPDDLDNMMVEGRSGAGSSGLGLTTIKMTMERLGGEAIFGHAKRGGAGVTLILPAV